MPTTSTNSPAVHVQHRRAQLLDAGVVAGPLFLVVSFAQIPFRDGFDMTRRAFSFLLLGPGGWVQTVNFLLVGLLYIAAGRGLRRWLTGPCRSGCADPGHHAGRGPDRRWTVPAAAVVRLPGWCARRSARGAEYHRRAPRHRLHPGDVVLHDPAIRTGPLAVAPPPTPLGRRCPPHWCGPVIRAAHLGPALRHQLALLGRLRGVPGDLGPVPPPASDRVCATRAIRWPGLAGRVT